MEAWILKEKKITNGVLLVKKQGLTSMVSKHWHSVCYDLSNQLDL